MKISVTVKDPDGFSYCVEEAVKDSVNAQTDLDDDEKEGVIEHRTKKVWKELEKFVKYKEYVTIEFDTDAGTAVVTSRA